MFRRLGMICHLALVSLLLPGFALSGEVTVFAAASLKDAMDEISGGFTGETGHKVWVSLAGSSALARQIAYGAPADVFLSANAQWMDYLEERSLIDGATRADLLGNRLVLVAPKGVQATGVSAGGIPEVLGGGRLAMALVEAVPAGQYGKAALTAAGVWDQIAGQVAQVDNVRAALALVAFGEAALGVVYETDARASEDVEIVGTFPAGSHPEIVYPMAAVSASVSPVTGDFLTYLQGDAARAAFERQGFRVLGEAQP